MKAAKFYIKIVSQNPLGEVCIRAEMVYGGRYHRVSRQSIVIEASIILRLTIEFINLIAIIIVSNTEINELSSTDWYE